MLRVTVEDLGQIVILHCAGRFVLGEETSILCTALRYEGRNIVLDLNGVSAIDAAGLGALVTLQAAGIYFQLVDPPEPVRRVLSITGLDSMFEICRKAEAGVVLDQSAA